MTHWKRSWCWERLKAQGEGDDRMRWLDGITDLMDVGSLACCSPWGRKESGMTERLKWTELHFLGYIKELIQCVHSPVDGHLGYFPAKKTAKLSIIKDFSSVQWLSRVWLFATPWTAAHQDSLSITNSQSLLKLMSIKSVMPSNYLILCRPLLLLPSIFPSIRVFSNESVLLIKWPKYWSFSISEYSGLISFRIDWFDLLAVQGTLKSLLQHRTSKASILWRSCFFRVQLSLP